MLLLYPQFKLEHLFASRSESGEVIDFWAPTWFNSKSYFCGWAAYAEQHVI